MAEKNPVYGLIKGNRRDSNLLWIKDEKFLYVKKDTKTRGIDYICYQTIRSNPKKKRNENVIQCTSRRIVDAEGKVTKNSIPHSNHENHESYYKDMMSKNAIIDTVILLRALDEDIGIRYSTHDVFTKELSK